MVSTHQITKRMQTYRVDMLFGCEEFESYSVVCERQMWLAESYRNEVLSRYLRMENCSTDEKADQLFCLSNCCQISALSIPHPHKMSVLDIDTPRCDAQHLLPKLLPWHPSWSGPSSHHSIIERTYSRKHTRGGRIVVILDPWIHLCGLGYASGPGAREGETGRGAWIVSRR